MSRRHHLPAIGLGLLVATFAAMPASLAQPATEQSDRTTLSRAELDAFADLVKEAPYFVAGRLYSNPDWLPLASEAAEARMHRLGRGKAMTTVAVPALLIGGALLVGYAIHEANWDSSRCSQDDQSGCDFHGILLVYGGISLATGLVLGGVGLYDLTRLTDAEYRALDRYAPGSGVRPPPSWTPNSDSFARLGGSLGKSFRVPLLAFRF
jgi:hypothetical protein